MSAPGRWIRTQPDEHRMRDMNPGAFHRALEGRHGQRLEVVIQVTKDPPALVRKWDDVAVYWEGPYTTDAPVPSRRQIGRMGARFGAHAARCVVRTQGRVM